MKKPIILLALTTQLICIGDVYADCGPTDANMVGGSPNDIGCKSYGTMSRGKDYKLYSCIWNGGPLNNTSAGNQCCIPPISTIYRCTLV